MAVDRFAVYITVGKVYSAGKSRVSVDNHYFPVVAVIIMGRNKRRKGRKNLAFYSEFFQKFRIVSRKSCEFVGSVIDNSYVNAFLNLFCKDFKNLSPHYSFIDYEIFKEYKMARFFKLGKHFVKSCFAYRKIGNFRSVKNRKTTGSLKIFCNGGGAFIFFTESFKNFRFLWDFFLC